MAGQLLPACHGAAQCAGCKPDMEPVLQLALLLFLSHSIFSTVQVFGHLVISGTFAAQMASKTNKSGISGPKKCVCHFPLRPEGGLNSIFFFDKILITSSQRELSRAIEFFHLYVSSTAFLYSRKTVICGQKKKLTI
jgi:hypothetical protein